MHWNVGLEEHCSCLWVFISYIHQFNKEGGKNIMYTFAIWTCIVNVYIISLPPFIYISYRGSDNKSIHLFLNPLSSCFILSDDEYQVLVSSQVDMSRRCFRIVSEFPVSRFDNHLWRWEIPSQQLCFCFHISYCKGFIGHEQWWNVCQSSRY